MIVSELWLHFLSLDRPRIRHNHHTLRLQIHPNLVPWPAILPQHRKKLFHCILLKIHDNLLRLGLKESQVPVVLGSIGFGRARGLVVSVVGDDFLDLVFEGEAGLVVFVLADEGFVLWAEVGWAWVNDSWDEDKLVVNGFVIWLFDGGYAIIVSGFGHFYRRLSVFRLLHWLRQWSPWVVFRRLHNSIPYCVMNERITGDDSTVLHRIF